jgi:predicted deacylase
MDLVHLSRNVPELIEIDRLAGDLPRGMRVRVLDSVIHHGVELPIHCFEAGPDDPETPVFLLTGGVHGLERIGTHVVIAYMKTLFSHMAWDEAQHDHFKKARLIIVPLVNPAGMLLRSRSNGRGVDLMRNAPVEAVHNNSWVPFVGGHRLGPFMAWYRGAGADEGAMEKESQALEELVRGKLFPAKAAISLDVHSGFGTVDRLWFPYAKSRDPFPSLAEIYRLNALLDSSYPNHIYKVEPQSLNYTTHGDLWDYFYDQHSASKFRGGTYLPLALELGSWLWVKKNPLQIFSLLGAFNPIIRHRYQRILRRHLALLDFMTRAAASHGVWSRFSETERKEINEKAHDRWYSEFDAGLPSFAGK